jgi:HAD superfamily hydrolase (TIGR01484 family)
VAGLKPSQDQAGLQPLAQWQPQGLLGLFTDIDDTLSTEGAITPDALQALAYLRASGFKCVPITGRPVAWTEAVAGDWPVDALVAENGAVALVPGPGGRLRRIYQQDPATRQVQHERMQAVLALIERSVPGAVRSRDSAGRETDIAIDHSEFTQLPQERIDDVVRLMQAQGLRASVSSIHINGWCGSHDKFTGACWIARELWGRDLAAEIGRWAYVGDSTNDQVMFQHFAHSVGVANIRRFAAQLSHRPRYLAEGERGAGFAEVVCRLLSQGRACA